MKKYQKMLLFAVIGASLGYAYYYFIGCTTGGCPLTSRWYITTVYGMLGGIVMGLPKKENENEKPNGEKPG